MLFLILVFATILTHLLSAGLYERELVDGRQRVIAGSYQIVQSTPVGLLGLFKAFPLGFKAAAEIIFVVLAGGIMFGVLEKTGMIENAIGTLVKKLGLRRRYLILFFMTYVFGLLGIVVGYENNIAVVPIAAVLSLALGGDLILAAGMSVAAITIGFGLSPINPYTVGMGHKIAEMPLFSGALFRSILCFSALSLLAYYNVRYFRKIVKNGGSELARELNTDGLALSKELSQYKMERTDWLVLFSFIGGLAIMLYGIFQYHWYLNEISAMFLMISLASGIICWINPTALSENVLKSIGAVAPGAFMVGYAAAIKAVLEMGNISDTMAYSLSNMLIGMPESLSAICMSIGQCVMNLMIPSGSGQALATLPIMIPLGDILGITRQTTILAFQIGDGVTNLANPALGGLIAMLGLCRVPFDRWLRFIFPLLFVILFISWLALLLAVAIEYGPV
jgi:uncharacterized ion transporter superfamily protein YfcC